MAKKLGLTVGAIAKRVNVLEFQFDLFRKANMETTMAERNKFVLSESAEDKVNRGEELDLMCLGNYKLVKRNNPISIFEVNGHLNSVAALAAANPSAKMGKAFSERSKDENKNFLNGQEICSVEWKELIS